jgi:ribosomal protein L37AE/L43A
VSTLPRWARVVRRKLLAKPEITETPRCQACARLMAPRDMRPTGYCTDCNTEIAAAFDGYDDGPFLPGDEDAR